MCDETRVGGTTWHNGSVRALHPAVLGSNLATRKWNQEVKMIFQRTCRSKIVWCQRNLKKRKNKKSAREKKLVEAPKRAGSLFRKIYLSRCRRFFSVGRNKNDFV